MWLKGRNPQTFKDYDEMADIYQLAYEQLNTSTRCPPYKEAC